MPLTWAAQQQGGTAKHTQDAEVVSMAEGMVKDALPIQELLARMLRRPVKLICREDNEAAIVAARKGYSPSLRHIPRTQKISISSLHDLFFGPDVHDETNGSLKLIYHETNTHKADVFTKSMAPIAFRQKLDLLRAHRRSPALGGA